MIRVILILTVILFAGEVCFAGSLNAYTAIEEKIGADIGFSIPLNPLGVEVDLSAALGLTRKADICLDILAFSIADEIHWLEGVWLMPRYDFGEISILNYNILGLQLGYHPHSREIELSLQYHTELSLIKLNGRNLIHRG